MQHELLRRHAEIPDHLHRLRILQSDMLLITPRFMELLMHELAEQSPLIAMPHDQEMVPSCHEVVRNVRRRSIAVDGALLIQHRLDQTPIRQHHRCGWSELEREDASVLLRPFRESRPSRSLSSQVLRARKRERKKECPSTIGLT
jgi:hypothetical protein